MTHHPATARSKREPHRHLFLPGRGSGEQQVGDVGARDEQHDGHHDHQQPEGSAVLTFEGREPAAERSETETSDIRRVPRHETRPYDHFTLMPISREKLLAEGWCERRFNVWTFAHCCTRDDVQPADADLLGPRVLQIESSAGGDMLAVPHRLLKPQRQPHIDGLSDPDS